MSSPEVDGKLQPLLIRFDKALARLTPGWLFIAGGGLLFGFYVCSLAISDRLQGPPINTRGDEPDYDNIACQLRTSGEFAVDYRDPAFLAPYIRAAAIG